MTLACNIGVFINFGCLKDSLEILRAILADDHEEAKGGKGDERGRNRQGKEVVCKYPYDSDYTYLHERVSELFAEALKSDLEFLKLGEAEKVSFAFEYCPSIDSPTINRPWYAKASRGKSSLKNPIPRTRNLRRLITRIESGRDCAKRSSFLFANLSEERNRSATENVSQKQKQDQRSRQKVQILRADCRRIRKRMQWVIVTCSSFHLCFSKSRQEVCKDLNNFKILKY